MNSIRNVFIGFLVLFTLAVGLSVMASYDISLLPNAALIGLRWSALAVLAWLAFLKKDLTVSIMVGMAFGIEIGIDFSKTAFPEADYPQMSAYFQMFSKIFIKLIKTIVAPLLFATLVVGIAGHSDIKQVGRMGVKSLIYFEIVTTLALFIGVAAINLTKVGEGVNLQNANEDLSKYEAKKQSGVDIILHTFPENFAKSVADGEVLQIVIFSILFGTAMLLVGAEKRKPVLEFAESLSEIMFKFTKIVMYYAPFGVCAAVAYTVRQMGLGVLLNLFQLLGTLYLALAVFILLVLLPIALIVRVPLRKFINAISEPVSIAFATTSSEAALPRAMEAMEKIGVPRKVVAFVMPTGYSFNLDGTTLYLALASIFVAQAGGIDLTWQQQLVMVFTLMLTSKGVAGVPRASLVILMGTAASFGLPYEPIMAILGIDALMDMARTSVNVMGNCLATFVVARWEGEIDEEKLKNG